jgi:hypothetical protein
MASRGRPDASADRRNRVSAAGRAALVAQEALDVRDEVVA